MAPFEIPAGAEILSAMITPAVLISASGTLSLATANRLGRVVDRIRVLSEIAETLANDPPPLYAEEKKALITTLMLVLVRRMRLLQTAVTMLYTAIGIFIATSITLGLTLTAKYDNGIMPTVIGLLGAGAMLAAVSFLVIETRLAVQSTIAEVEFTQRVVERATKVHEVSQAPPPMA